MAPPTTASSTTTTTTEPEPEPEPDDEDPPGVTLELIDEGAEPRRPLRLDPVEGDVTTARLETAMSIEQSVEGETLPAAPALTMAADLRFTVASVTTEGIEVDFAYESIELLNAEDFPPELRTQVESAFEGMTGITGSSLFNHRGVALDGSFEAPDTLDPAAQQSLDQVSEQIQQLSVPFPREDVGEGAQWRVTQETSTQGITTTQIATYTLDELDDDRYVLSVAMTQSAEDQEIDMPQAPAGVTIELVEFDFSGEGTTEGTLTKVTPTSSSARNSGTSVLSSGGEAPAGQSFERLVQEMEVEMTFNETD